VQKVSTPVSNAIQSFRDLDTWKIAMDLTMLIYEIVTCLPSSEQFVLSAQMRRAVVSVPSNVAEGHSCGEDGRYIHHLRIALGSLGELATHIEIARRRSWLSAVDLRRTDEQIARTGQVLHGLLRSRRMKRVKKLGTHLAVIAMSLGAMALLST